MANQGCYGSPNTGYYAAQNFFDQLYGVAGVDYGALTVNYVGLASGMVWGSNPPYYLSDLLAIYSKFFGPATTFIGNTVSPAFTKATITIDSNIATVPDATGISVGWEVTGIGIPEGTIVTAVNGLAITLSNVAFVNGTVPATFADPVGSYQIAISGTVAGLSKGQLLTGMGIPPGTVVVSASTSLVTLSKQVTASGTGTTFNFYQTPWVPLVVIQLFINVALASIMQRRWLEMWPLGMALYIAHNLTLWMRTESGPNSTAAQIVASGLQIGMLTSKSVGDVSAGITLVGGFLEDWGAYQQTEYGIQFATYAAAIGSGPIWVGSSPGIPGGYGLPGGIV